MTISSTTKTMQMMSGDRFSVVSELKKQLQSEVYEKYCEEAKRLFRSASRAKVLESRGINIYSSYGIFMSSFDDIEGFLVAFEKDFRESHKKSFFLKEQSGFVEIYDEYCHGCIEVILVAQVPVGVDLSPILKGEAANMLDIFF